MIAPVDVAGLAEGLSGAALLAAARVFALTARRNARLDARRQHAVDRPGAQLAPDVVRRLLDERIERRVAGGLVLSHRADRRPDLAPPAAAPVLALAPLQLTAGPEVLAEVTT